MREFGRIVGQSRGTIVRIGLAIGLIVGVCSAHPAEIQPGTAIATLHAAIEEANAFPGPDTISVAVDHNNFCGCAAEPCKVELDTPARSLR